MATSSGPQARSARTLGTVDAAAIGAAAMLGAGVFSVFAPAALGAGAWLPVAILIAGAVAYCNAVSSARLAARHPENGGTYVYGRERLGDLWGYLAGWSFVVGKIASCAAMALTFAAYTVPEYAKPVAVAAVVVLAAVNYRGVRRSTLVIKVLLLLVLAVLVAVFVTMLLSGRLAAVAQVDGLGPWPGSFGVLGAAGMIFFAFAGYARIATLGGQVRDPRVTIPRAITLSLGTVLALYLVIGTGLLIVLGRERLTTSHAPLVDAVQVAGFPLLVPFVIAGAALASLGALVPLLMGVSHVTAAMAADGHLPRPLAAMSERYGVPFRAEAVVAAIVIGLILVADLTGAIAFSAFGVLVYYAITNASALRLGPDENRPPLIVPVTGLVGCVVLATSLPLPAVVAGVLVLGAGAGLWWLRHHVLV
ncbi:APC family permease [Nocardiopsis metallicus]|uniref:APA family basic amino acid/polyamine antiporter n=1 Tax=Nocardiopsis metallicus TaxID=179819 RepID=A0A840W3D1_9ACTN|nr:APC family permease [Nocardiopsis metallicus]MBB5490484.1 APA family basic amino acid/polyamine antiporter [Nocardiopsis metallicus]